MTANTLGLLLIVCAVFCDLFANILLKKSMGFTYRHYGYGALACVALSFLSLAYAIQVIDLSVAYALFGAFGIMLTTLADTCFYGLRIRPLGVGGLIAMLIGIVLIKIS